MSEFKNSLVVSAKSTVHCLTGCAIGEITGLLIAVILGLSVFSTIVLATLLAYFTGFSLGVLPVMRDQGKTFIQALKLIWLGEVISIGVMEITMNAVDYQVGGMTAESVFEPVFWYAIVLAMLAGFIAAWPVNWFLLKRGMKKHCH